MALTDKQQRFVDLYNGNATETAKRCGYADPRNAGLRCLKHADISRQIKEKREKEIKPLVMDRIARQKLWTDFALDKKKDDNVRLKASELLGKSEGDFITKHAMDESMSTGLSGLIERIQSKTGKNQ